jgi:DnaJ-class molecular chaperone
MSGSNPAHFYFCNMKWTAIFIVFIFLFGSCGPRHKTCDNCNGNGSVVCPSCFGKCKTVCDYCEGKGQRSCVNCTGNGRMTITDYKYVTTNAGLKYQPVTRKVVCTKCKSKGTVNCDACTGKGGLDCSVCGGKGKAACSKCMGKGTLSNAWKLR